jgi:hypothetical protein
MRKSLLTLATASALFAAAAPASADYAATTMSTPGVSSLWRLGESSGTTAADARGVRNGTYGGGVRLRQAPAPIGTTNTSVGLDGVDDQVSFGDGYDHAGTAKFTVEAWIKPSTTGAASTWRRILSKETTGSSRGGYTLYIFPESAGSTRSQRIGFERASGGAVDSVRSTTAAEAGEWHHVAVTYDGAAMRLYFDGKLEGTTTSTRSLPNTSAILRLGASSSGGGRYGGLLDDVSVHSTALTAQTIAQQYSVGTTAPAPAPEVRAETAPLLVDEFTGADGVITSAAQFWGAGSTDPIWEGESGTMYRRSNTAWTNDSVFRFWTKRSDFSDVRVNMNIRVNSFTQGTADRPAADWNGVKIWLRRQVVNGSSSANVKPGLYTAEVTRRQGNVIIQKKCGGQDAYVILANTPWSGSPNPARIGQSEPVGGTIRTNADGSVTIEVIRDGAVVLTGTDRGAGGCGPITGAGKVGYRADNTDFNVDDFTVLAH